MTRTELIRPLHELLATHADRLSGKTAFRDGRGGVTYGELARRTGRLAGHLADLGVGRGGRAAIYLGNRVEMVESYLAITRASAVGVPLNPGSSDAELSYLLDDCAATVVITDSARGEQVLRVAGDRVGVVVVGDAGVPEGVWRYETLATTDPAGPARDDLGMDEPAWMLYTSGTTGQPKGVVSTQRKSLWATASCNAPILGLCAEDRVLWPMPLFHCVAHNLCVLGVVAVGATAHIMEGLDADEMLRTVREERSTFMVGVPTMFHHMVEAARAGGFTTHDLRVCMVAGSACPEPLHETFKETFGISLLDSYGSTETGGAITTNWPDAPRVPGSCGLPLPGLVVRLTDPGTGQEAADGEEGEIWVSSPALMDGYHGQPEATAAALSDGWYHTGDLARRNDDGYISITGRIKELIIRGGENIHPGEVEKVLTGIPGVADAAVGGKRHEVLGEVPVAYLVAGPAGIDAELVMETCRTRLSYFKVPDEIHAVAEIPRTPAGKIVRRELAGLPATLLAVNPMTRARAAEPEPPAAGRADAPGLGVSDAEHPLLGAVVELPESPAVLFTGRLSAHGHGWLGEHLVQGVPVVPASVFVELAVRAGDQVGTPRLENLSPGEPLVLPRSGGVQIRVTVGGPQEAGARPVAVHSRPDGEVTGRPWTCHATGVLAQDVSRPGWNLEVWPPADAGAVPVASLYETSEHSGHHYGDALRQVRSVWRRGEDLFAEIVLPERDRADAAAFGLHPVALDAALHPLWSVPSGPGAGHQPGTWQGVSLHATGATVLRVRMTAADGGTWRIEAADATGAPVMTVESLGLRPVSRSRIRAASAAQQDALFHVEWTGTALPPAASAAPAKWAVVGDDALRARAGLMAAGQYAEVYPGLEALVKDVENGAAAPDVVVVGCVSAEPGTAGQEAAVAVHRTVRHALELARLWLATPAFDASRMVFLTRDAVPAWDGGQPLDLPAAAVWGLLRSAQTESPGRFVLVDTDASKPAWRAVLQGVASGEPQLALRKRTVRVPALVRADCSVRRPVLPAGTDGTVLVTGGTGLLGAAVARHLVAGQGVRDLLLAGRRGPAAPGAAELAAELTALGARVTVAACDVTDRAALSGLLAGLPADRPLRAVVHSAGVADDATVPSLTPDRLDAVLRPVVDAVLAVRETAAGAEPPAFVLFSSAAGVLGGAGQGGHAAAGAFLDAFAHRLRGEGVAAVSIAWGPWEHGTPDGADRRRRERDGVRPLAAEQAMALFDASWETGHGAVVAAPLDFTALRDRARAGEVLAPLRGLLPAPPRRRAGDAPGDVLDLRRRLPAMADEERDAVLLGLVRAQIASVLGHASADEVDVKRNMKDFGFDSLTALTVRNALNAATKLTLPQAVVFDFATPAALALHLKSELLAC